MGNKCTVLLYDLSSDDAIIAVTSPSILPHHVTTVLSRGTSSWMNRVWSLTRATARGRKLVRKLGAVANWGMDSAVLRMRITK